MNAKKAKALRKLVKNLETVNPSRITTTGYTEDPRSARYMEVEDLDAEGNPITKRVKVATGPVKVNPRSKRGIYLHLKKSM